MSASAIVGDVAKGRNPAADRKAAAVAERAKRVRNRLTLRVLIDDWNRLHLAKQRPSYAAEAVRALRRSFARILDDAAEDVDRASVVRALDALSRRKERVKPGKPKGSAIAGRTTAYGRTAFGWALKRGMVTANPLSKSASKRDRVLSDDEIGEIWRAAGKMAAPYGNIARLLILTGQRRGEVAGPKWNELREDLESWTVPGERTKNGVTNIVPLSAVARNLLRLLLPEDKIEAERALAERRAKGELVLPGLAGTFAGW
jgi:integrase